MPKDLIRRCVLILIADGFEETETITWLSLVRQAGLCIKSVGLTRGLVNGAHGISLKPDLALGELEPWLNTTAIRAVILPGGEASLARLEADPRTHKLLHRVIEQEGQIVTGPDCMPMIQAAVRRGSETGKVDDGAAPVLVCGPERSLETWAQDLVRRLI
ncbi:MAG TPA: DJ-1/PfpI family protein [Anaerolineae bacterium]|nr:DJ-1/PfpI family protein [Anaerolineae bacterium]